VSVLDHLVQSLGTAELARLCKKPESESSQALLSHAEKMQRIRDKLNKPEPPARPRDPTSGKFTPHGKPSK
jgi:hypothetical protein